MQHIAGEQKYTERHVVVIQAWPIPGGGSGPIAI